MDVVTGNTTAGPPYGLLADIGLSVVRPSVLRPVVVCKMGLSRLSHQGGGYPFRSLRGGHVREEDLNLSAIVMYIVSMISKISKFWFGLVQRAGQLFIVVTIFLTFKNFAVFTVSLTTCHYLHVFHIRR